MTSISLLSIAGKVLARILLNRRSVHVHLKDVLPQSQCGFRAGQGTADMIFAARQLQEKCREQHLDLYMIFIDLTKTFDSVHIEVLWRILKKIGCPQKFINIIQSFHDGIQGCVLNNGSISTHFGVTSGTNQFHLRCLRKIAHIRWQDMIPNTTVLERCEISGIELQGC